MATLIPVEERLFVCEYCQLVTAGEHGADRTLLCEGPLVLGRLYPDAHPVIQIGVPENLVTWQLTSDMPVLKASSNAFIFAVPYADKFNIIEFVPELQLPLIAAFEELLQHFTAYAVPEQVSQAHILQDAAKVQGASGAEYVTASKTASNIRAGAQWISQGIIHLGEKVGNGIVYAGEWYRQRVVPNDEKTKMSRISRATVYTAEKVTGKMASAAGYVADAVGGVVGSAAGAVAKGVHKTGVTSEGGSLRHSAEIGSASVVALIDVFDAMHEAGRHVVTLGAEETATCVEYKYGEDAARAARRAGNAASNSYDVYGAYRALRTKALLKAFAKGAVASGAAGPSGVVAESPPPALQDAPAPATGGTKKPQ